MITIREYKKVQSLEEAYELNQKKSNRIIGGMIWLKMETLNVGTAIDLSGLGLDAVEETETEFRIGAMTTLRTLETHEGLQDEAAEFGAFIADQGAEQCGFCNPGFIMNALALFREKEYPTEEEIKEYLAGNLCRCTGYEGQLRGILAFLAWKKQKEEGKA